MSPALRLGARSSPLSLAQTRHVQSRLAAALSQEEAAIEIAPFLTSGDRITDRTLAEAGGKGLFTKELDEALLSGRIDLAVHSLKDLPTRLPEGLVLAATPEREDPRDAFICRSVTRFEDLPPGALIGTASLRRQAQCLHARPDLRVVMLRGNVGTRLAKVEAGVVQASFLALAGLKRLGLAHAAASLLDPEAMPPAAGQGTLALVARAHDVRALAAATAIEDHGVRLAAEAERGVLDALDGSCRTPIAAFARVEGGVLNLIGEVLTPDGVTRWRETLSAPAGTPGDAAALGEAVGRILRARAGPAWVAAGAG